jgi:hypothetical protein
MELFIFVIGQRSVLMVHCEDDTWDTMILRHQIAN